MVLQSSRICYHAEHKKCRCFLPNKPKDHHQTSSSYKGNTCNKSTPCNICTTWDEIQWADFHKVHEESAARISKKHEDRIATAIAKGKSTSSFSEVQLALSLGLNNIQMLALWLCLSFLSHPTLPLTHSVLLNWVSSLGWMKEKQVLRGTRKPSLSQIGSGHRCSAHWVLLGW